MLFFVPNFTFLQYFEILLESVVEIMIMRENEREAREREKKRERQGE